MAGDALADATEGPASNAGKVLAVLGAQRRRGRVGLRGGSGPDRTESRRQRPADRLRPTRRRPGRGAGCRDRSWAYRWPDMHLSAGRVAASSLRSSLPRRRRGNAQLTLLSGARKGEGPAPDAVAAIVEAGRRAGEVVVCDVPRQLESAAWSAIDRADLTVIVTPAEVRAAVTAKQLAQELTDRGVNPQLVVRGPSPGGLRPDEIAASAGVPLLTTMRPEPQLAQSLERGTFHPRTKGPLARAARTTLAELAALPPNTRRGQGGLRAVS